MTDYSSYLKHIDAQRGRMFDLLTKWANTNSHSYNLEGLNRMLSLLDAEFAVLGGEMATVELTPQEIVDRDGNTLQIPLGKALHIRKRPAARLRIFLCCHMDTVYAKDHPFQECVRLDENMLKGPGVTDAKGGLVVMLKALEAFELSPWAENVGWEILINPDEEIGSRGSGPLLVQAAKHNHLGLVFEPCFADGNLVGARKGSGNFTAIVRGKAAHAGREPHKGRNAINALAGFITQLSSLPDSGSGITVNVGYIEGGGPVNVVPDLAVCRFNVRVMNPEDQALFEKHLKDVAESINQLDGISMDVYGCFARPPKPLGRDMVQLLEHVVGCGRDLGLALDWLPSGGACDGNNLAACGLATIDSLGVRGGNIHSSEEYTVLDSLVERAKLTALLLMKLGAGEIKWPP